MPHRSFHKHLPLFIGVLLIFVATTAYYQLTHKQISGSRSDDQNNLFTVGPYTVRVHAFTDTAPGTIAIFSSDTARTPIQIITLSDPNLWIAEKLPEFFVSQDVNFDGHADIGIPHGGGAKWAAYQYWLFDPETHTFVTTHFTDELRNITFNQFQLDPATQRITTNNFCGTLLCEKNIFSVTPDHFHRAATYHQEQTAAGCVITSVISGKTSRTTDEQPCSGYPLSEELDSAQGG